VVNDSKSWSWLPSGAWSQGAVGLLVFVGLARYLRVGHSTPQLTSDTYAHLSPRHLVAEAERISYPDPAQCTAKVVELAAGRS
jgi:hypothetical protein